MNQLTIRGFDAELQQRLESIAQEKGISLNKAALHLLRKGAELNETSKNTHIIGAALDEFIGSWSAKEETQFLQSIKACEQIDEDFWR
jgi:hypothetical protein